MAEEWKIVYYQEPEGVFPVREFILNSGLLPGEQKQFETRLSYLRTLGLVILGKRADVLERLEGKDAEGIYSLRMPNTRHNPRVLLCVVYERTFVLLHGFKEQNSSDYDAAIQIAKVRKNSVARAIEAANRAAAQEASQQAKKPSKGKKK